MKFGKWKNPLRSKLSMGDIFTREDSAVAVGWRGGRRGAGGGITNFHVASRRLPSWGELFLVGTHLPFFHSRMNIAFVTSFTLLNHESKQELWDGWRSMICMENISVAGSTISATATISAWRSPPLLAPLPI